MTDPHILCVDPDPEARATTAAALREGLEDNGISVETGEGVSAADATLGAGHLDCVVTELELPDGNALDLIERVRDQSPDAGCIVYTEASPERLDEVLGGDAEVLEVLSKATPEAEELLVELVSETVERQAQASYPLPNEETSRLEALEEYDLEHDALVNALHRVTELAKDHLGVETASINLIGAHEQEFYACQGAATDWETTPREESICTFTILSADEVLVVEDITKDPRFTTVDRLTDLGIRAYIGAPIVTPAGHVIGTLCGYDDKPRPFSDQEQTFHQTLATLAMDLLEAYRDPSVQSVPQGGVR